MAAETAPTREEVPAPKGPSVAPDTNLLRRLRRVVMFGFGIPAQDAEDVLQEALLQYFVEQNRRASVTEGLLVVITRRRCQDYWRSRRMGGDPLSLDESELALGDDGVLARRLYAGACIAQAWPCISPSCRRVLARRFWRQARTDDLAQLWGYKPGTLKRFISRCLERLRHHLKEKP